jgi:hypothetical protein
VKPAYNRAEKHRIFFSVSGGFRSIQILEIKDPSDYEISPLKRGFRSIEVSFKAGFAVINE